MQYAEVSEHKI